MIGGQINAGQESWHCEVSPKYHRIHASGSTLGCIRIRDGRISLVEIPVDDHPGFGS